MFDRNESLRDALQRNVRDALSEDIGRGDWTAQLVPAGRRAVGKDPRAIRLAHERHIPPLGWCGAVD